MIKYYWIRIYDYAETDRDDFLNADDRLKDYHSIKPFSSYKGTLLDEYYFCGDEMTREEVKLKVEEKSNVNKFAKPRKTSANERTIYAIIMESNKFYYDRFTTEVDTVCFNCYAPIKGKLKDFPKRDISGETVYFCSYQCCGAVNDKLDPRYEGEWQTRFTECGVHGYIYHIYNRKNNKHYIGQSIYAPFFRWQEHYKSGLKGDITDLQFDVITEVRVRSRQYLNSIEAWWIRKYIKDYGENNVMNITIPPITDIDLLEKYHSIIEGQKTIAKE